MTMTPFVVFDSTTGAPLRWGSCQLEMLEDQGSEGERVLATSQLSVEGNHDLIWSEVKAIREQRYNAGISTPFGQLDTKPESRDFINGLVTIAVAAVVKNDTTYARAFTKADDTQVTLNAHQIIAVGEMVEAYINATHQHSQALRAQIYAAANMAQLLAIDVTAGWPGLGTEG